MSGPSSNSSRTCSPNSVPPGSRVATTVRPSASSAPRNRSICVDLPEPSIPSKVTNTACLGYEAMRAVVTGGAGFIGSHLVDALVARGDEAHVLDNLATGSRENLASAAELHKLDIRDEALEELAARLRPEVVFHLAAQADVGTSVERP